MRTITIKAAIVMAVLFVATSLARADETRGYLVNVNPINPKGVILDGHDAVAFFTEKKPVKGSERYRSVYNGAIYLFASAENKRIFDADPRQYAPQYGGFCAVSMSMERLEDGDVRTWSIVDGRLFLQRNEKGLMMWRQDTPGLIKRADANWPRLLEQYGSTITEAQLTPRRELSLEAARQIAREAHDHAMRIQAPSGSIAVVDAGGHLLYLERLDNTFAASAMVAYQKAQTAALFRMPSRKLEDAIVGGRTSLATTGYTMLQGGEPILYRGQVVGAIGVSGTASAQQDEEVALAGRNATFSPESATGVPKAASTETRAAK